MDSIHAVLQAVEQSEENSVLATIVRVIGSSYRKEGTVSLFLESGKQVGMLTAGCLEEELSSRAREMYGSEGSKLFVYDLSSETESEWGRGLGCNGQIHVVLESVKGKRRQSLKEMKSALDSGLSVVDKKFVGDQTFIQHYDPKPRLVLFGAGADAIPVAELAVKIGFYVIITDWRPSYCVKESFPGAEERWVGEPHEVVPQLGLRSDDCVVVMSHVFEKDKEILYLLRDIPLHYLGVLGSKARIDKLMNGETWLRRVRSPVGLPIGAEGPEEIAVSIAAELILHVRRMRSQEIYRPTS